MKVIILAGGFATRLKPLTDNLPKSLLPLNNDLTVIDEQVASLFLEQEIESIVVITNNKFYNSLENWRKKSVFFNRISIINNDVDTESKRLGPIGDLCFALNKLGQDSDIFVLGCDVLFSCRFGDILNFFNKNRNSFVIASYHLSNSNVSRQPSEIVFDSNGRVLKFVEKPIRPQSPYFSPMLYILPQEKLKAVNLFLQENYSDNAGDFISWLVKNGYEVMAYKMEGQRFDIGDHQSYKSTLDSYKTL